MVPAGIGDVGLIDRATRAERFDLALGPFGGIGVRDVVQRDVGALSSGSTQTERSAMFGKVEAKPKKQFALK